MIYSEKYQGLNGEQSIISESQRRSSHHQGKHVESMQKHSQRWIRIVADQLSYKTGLKLKRKVGSPEKELHGIIRIPQDYFAWAQNFEFC